MSDFPTSEHWAGRPRKPRNGSCPQRLLAAIRVVIGTVAALCVTAIGPSLFAASDTNPAAKTNSPARNPEPPPVTARDLFNAGTRKLGEGKLREAESFLQSALARQDESVQTPALYNLGHVRFAQGVEELKKSLEAKPTAARGRNAIRLADRAIQMATSALASKEIEKMVAAYLNGRGARKELKAATEAVRRAIEAHGVALRKWQRSLGDFQSAVELNPADTNAQHNVEVVQRAIAQLVDSLKDLQEVAMGMAQRKNELGEKMQQLKGQIPEPFAPPGAGEDDEEDDQPKGPREGDQEGPTKDGQEIPITPEEAGWLLEGFKLDGDRRLPMGPNNQGQPRERNKRNW